ncbi:hypothetical protein CL633_00555 [bacterium]|nr:hypothetical protein [bacterium]|tara:strand:+ start:21021 stop:21380 length:360 start_codon:yes stop_codon:yes gene_type:complete
MLSWLRLKHILKCISIGAPIAFLLTALTIWLYEPLIAGISAGSLTFIFVIAKSGQEKKLMKIVAILAAITATIFARDILLPSNLLLAVIIVFLNAIVAPLILYLELWLWQKIKMQKAIQ